MILSGTRLSCAGFSAARNTISRIIVIGDSMSSDAQSAQYPPATAGLSWPSRLGVLRPSTDIVNYGTSSMTAATMISLYPSLVSPYIGTRSIIAIEAGYNDFNAGDSAATVAGRLQTLATLAKTDGFKVLLFMVHAPDQATFSSTSTTMKERCERLRDINRIILQNHASWGVDFLYRYDLAFDAVADRDTNGRPFNAARFFTDGLHPVTETSQRMAEQINALISGNPTGIVTYPLAPLESQLNRDSEFDADWRAGNRFVPALSGSNAACYFFDRYIAKHSVLDLASGSLHVSEINARTFGNAYVSTSNNTTLCKLARVSSTGKQVFKAGNTGGGVTSFVIPASVGVPWVWGWIGFGVGGGKIFGPDAYSPSLAYSGGRYVFNHAGGTVNVSPLVGANNVVAIAVRLDGASSKVYYFDGTALTITTFSTASTTPATLNLGKENVGSAIKLHHAAFLSCQSSSINDADLELWMRNSNHYGVGAVTSYGEAYYTISSDPYTSPTLESYTQP